MDIRCCDSFCFCKSVQPFSCFTTFTKSIGSDPCCVKAVIRYINHTVNDDYRDVCIFCFLKNCIPSCLCNRCKKNVINLLLDEVTDCCDLVFLFLLSIIKDQVISVFFAECVFHWLRVCCTPVRFCTYLWETYCDHIIGWAWWITALVAAVRSFASTASNC